MNSIVDTSVYCLPADILGEGADRVVGTVRDRAGLPGVTVAACYHASREILPHNPVYRVASLAPGAFYAVDSSACPGPCAPPTPTPPSPGTEPSSPLAPPSPSSSAPAPPTRPPPLPSARKPS
jgi:hypothetical protein